MPSLNTHEVPVDASPGSAASHAKVIRPVYLLKSQPLTWKAAPTALEAGFSRVVCINMNSRSDRGEQFREDLRQLD